MRRNMSVAEKVSYSVLGVALFAVLAVACLLLYRLVGELKDPAPDRQVVLEVVEESVPLTPAPDLHPYQPDVRTSNAIP